MNRRRTRTSRTFGLESLEIRNAPSHFGVVAHAAAALRQVHPAAHVRHIADSETNHKKELTESGSSLDSSKDSGTDSINSGSSSNDPSSPDPKSNR
jgi:hypothetical protein